LGPIDYGEQQFIKFSYDFGYDELGLPAVDTLGGSQYFDLQSGGYIERYSTLFPASPIATHKSVSREGDKFV